MSAPWPILAPEAGALEGGEPSPQAPAPTGSLVHQLLKRLSGASLLSTEDKPSPSSLPQSQPHPWPALRLSSVSTRRVATAEQQGCSTPTAILGFLSPRGSDHEGFTPLASGGSDLTSPLLEPWEAAAAAPGAASLGASSRQPHHRPARGARLARACVVGLVNSIVAIPVTFSFAAIIFQAPFFAPYLGSLVKLVFLSSAIHAAAFSSLSTMPFAVGQVQDVGLIFLSAEASGVAAYCAARGASPAETLATVLVAVSCSTALVGLLIVATGALRLASLVQYVPLPVIGGYLAYVGVFCMSAGVTLACGLQFPTIQSLAQLANAGVLARLLPAVALCMAITVVTRRFRSPYALPALLLATPLLFYAALAAAGMSLADAQAAGWVTRPQPGDGGWRFWEAWKLYMGDAAATGGLPPLRPRLAALLPQWGKILALYFVVAFGSSMDVAAIQADSPVDLDFNRELVTVGLSNAIAGAAGGQGTGSYIFSQTLFSMRMGVDTPAMGAVLAVSELIIFMLPINVMTYLPKFFFAALCIWIGFDILKDWLFVAAKRLGVLSLEYGLLVGTLAAIIGLGLEVGIVAGIVAAAASFAYSYAKVTVTAFTVVPSRSGAVRTLDQRAVLDLFSPRLTAVKLSGYLFFGSAVRIKEQVLAVAAATLQQQPHLGEDESASVGGDGGGGRPPGEGVPGDAALANGVAAGPLMRAIPSSLALSALRDNASFTAGRRRQLGGGAGPAGGGSGGIDPDVARKAGRALVAAPRFLILDFRRVPGIDATAARSFAALHSRLARMGLTLVLTRLCNPAMLRLMGSQGLTLCTPPPPGGVEAAGPSALPPASAEPGESCCLVFPSMEAGLQYCEGRFLEAAVRYRLLQQPPEWTSLAAALAANLELPRALLGQGYGEGEEGEVDYEAAAARLERYTRRRTLRGGEALFSRGDPADAIFVVEYGSIACLVDYLATTPASRAAAIPHSLEPAHASRLFTFGAASCVGDLDFVLSRPRSFTAECSSAAGGAGVWEVSRAAFEEMGRAEPGVLLLLQTIILRSTSLSAAHALEALERSGDA